MLRVSLVVLMAVSAFGAMPTLPYRGKLPENFSPKIILGADAPAGQFPYIVSLHHASSGGHACGASVLTANALLTAAHCCLADKLYVYAGSQKQSSGGKRYEISQMLVHEKYVGQDNDFQNDLCVIKLQTSLPLGDTIAQVKLPASDLVVPDGGLVTIVGWGLTVPGGNKVPDVLQIGKNYVALSNSKCSTESGINVFKGEICAHGAGTGQGVCNGDSGSPLTYNGVQVGIASFVFLPCGSPAPDFYARVSNYVDWIQQKLGNDASNLIITSTL